MNYVNFALIFLSVFSLALLWVGAGLLRFSIKMACRPIPSEAHARVAASVAVGVVLGGVFIWVACLNAFLLCWAVISRVG